MASVTGPGIHVRSLTKSFGDVAALAPTTLHIEPGEVATVLGPSGCGKTTLLRMIGGLEAPSAGEVTIDGDTPANATRNKRIGFIPQSPALLPWRTVLGNASILRELRSGRNSTELPDVAALLDRVGLGDFHDAYPHELSGGMQQRVGLVRAFALGAPYLLMDEPFAALDEITRADMRHLLASLCEPTNATVVFVTHSLAEAVFLSDRVLVLSARPGQVAGEISVDLPRPRVPELEDTPAFFEIERELRSLLHGAARA